MGTAYVHNVARIRALEARLLKKIDLEQLVNTATFPDSANGLKNKLNWATVEGVLSFPDMLAAFQKEEKMLFSFVAGSILDKELAVLISTYPSLTAFKNLFKHNLTRQDNKSEVPENLPDFLRQSWQQIIKLTAEVGWPDLKIVDLVVDAGYLKALKTAIEKLNSKLLFSFFQLLVDLFNIKTWLRFKLSEVNSIIFTHLFLEDGKISLDVFLQSRELSAQDFLNKLKYQPYYQELLKTWQEIKKDENWERLDVFFTDQQINSLRRTKLIYDGPEPIVAYLWVRLAEIQNLRIILYGKFYNLPKESIMEKLSVPYV